MGAVRALDAGTLSVEELAGIVRGTDLTDLTDIVAKPKQRRPRRRK